MRLILLFCFLLGCGTPVPAFPGKYTKEWLHGCWNDQGLVDATWCKNPEPLTWEHNKFVVTSISEKYASIAIEATVVWNEWVGFELFEYRPFDGQANVIIFDGGYSDQYNGITRYIVYNDRRLAIIEMFKVRSDTVVHELGHVLGLEHDPDNRRSIMYPSSDGRTLPYLEPIDRRLIRERYAIRRN